VPDEAVDADLDDGKARLTLSDRSVFDYGSIPNGLFHFAPPKMAEVSLDLRWFNPIKRGTFSDATKPFAMNFVQTNAHISWRGHTGSDTFHTIAGAQTVHFAQIARERNGVFFGDND
jgi:hypothetical protein